MASKEQGKGLPIVVIVLVLLLGIGGGAAGMWGFSARASGGGEAPAQQVAVQPAAPAQYVAMEPAFVVNLADEDGTRYLQVDVQLMTRDPAAAASIEGNLPALRNGLVMLFSQQYAEQLRTRQSKEALQAEALEEVQRILVAESGRPQAEALYFTSFVTQ